MVGESKTRSEEAIISNESKIYHDIVQGKYPDYYQLLTYKALSSLFWIDKNCPKIKWVIHTDDDVILNVYQFSKFISSLSKKRSSENYFYCRALFGKQVQRSGKWGVNISYYKSEYYPPYCDGPFWITSRKNIPHLLQSSTKIDYLWVDDAYLTGLLRQNSKIGIRDVHIKYRKFFYAHVYRKYPPLAWVNIDVNKIIPYWGRIKGFYKNNESLNH